MSVIQASPVSPFGRIVLDGMAAHLCLLVQPSVDQTIDNRWFG